MEFAEIFANGLTTQVYLYGSAILLAALVVVALAITHQPRVETSAIGLRRPA
jgi:hypothetical protein